MYTDPKQSKILSQQVPIAGKKNDTYKLSFWYKNEGIRSSGMESGNMVVLTFHYTEEIQHGVPTYLLNLHATEWQNFQMTMTAEADYTSFSLSIISQNNANPLYVTHFNLTKDFGLNTYQYDNNGNLISSADLSKESSTFQYDHNNQLVSSFTPKGSNYKFEYDNTDSSLLRQGISSMGLANTFEYDNHKNPVKTMIQNVGKKDSLITDSYYIRSKSTTKYFKQDYNNKQVLLKEFNCNRDSWQLEKSGDSYYIKSLMTSYYLKTDNIEVFLVSDKTSSTLFTIQENTNGSYSFLPKDTSDALTDDNGVLKLSNFAYENHNQQFFLESTIDSFVIETKAEYTSDGKFITKTIDALGHETLSNIDETTGNLMSITNPKGETTTYTYNSKEQLTSVTKNNQSVTYDYNEHQAISNIHSNNKNYHFDYDNFLNTKQVKINNQLLVENNYEEKNGNLTNVVYANNTSISYTYDELDRLKTLSKGNITYNYFYNNLNELVKITTNTNDQYTYTYDFANRLSHYQYNENSIKYTYDINSNVLSKTFQNDTIHKIIYDYDNDDNITKVHLDNHVLNYTYDELGRLVHKNIDNNIPVEYTYYRNGNQTSFILKSMKIENDEYRYVYDDVDNITHIYLNDGLIQHYQYDKLNELIKEENYQRNISYRYTYDHSGNLLSKKEYELNTDYLIKEDTYEYSNENWEDQLTKYNDEVITYDAIGNPITIGERQLTWNNGRELQSISSSDLNTSYKYNKDGVRTEKIVNNVITKYFNENSSIIFETTGNNMLYYIRDDQNRLLGFKYNDSIYYYKRNIQEDIIGIYNNNYELIATYEYDAWGKLLTVKDVNGNKITDESHIAYINPFRYRSYYYDKETKLYYLNSRYYNPEWGRFINADGIIGTSSTNMGYNLYAYVLNSPSMMEDSDGGFPLTLSLGAGVLAVGLAAVAGLAIVSNSQQAKSTARAIENYIEKKAEAIKEAVQSTTKSSTAVNSCPKEITAEAAKERVDQKPYEKETKIYRYGKANPGNLTPRVTDTDGLSFMLKPSAVSVVTTIEAVNRTGILKAFQDKPYHVAVKPIGHSMSEWIEQGSDSIWTKTLKSIVVRWDGK